MSAFDPKRILVVPLPENRRESIACVALRLGGNETARFHHTGGQRNGGGLAPSGCAPKIRSDYGRIGILMGGINNPTARSLITAFEQTLKQLGWAEGSNLQIDIRWGDNSGERVAGYAREPFSSSQTSSLSDPPMRCCH